MPLFFSAFKAACSETTPSQKNWGLSWRLIVFTEAAPEDYRELLLFG